ncbi:hypothetical protein [Phycicoccus sp. Soil802]|uniref:hypothetical protein n=1 Tax=Phycicoccus sp. Soil802 TaxID=1736414 RepID=UPI000703A3A1|nr:hypothetical protein [Phycicoccus sp. Soil802]KRF29464.1 hypothetical protein ASG91_00045 [Phycicoccus sp. Soil802]
MKADQQPSGWDTPPDETLARPALVGALAHMAIAAVLADPHGVGTMLGSNGWRRALWEADRLLCPPLVESRAHRQIIASAVTVYFRQLLPPPQWSLLASEPLVSGTRPDVLWRHRSGRLLADEIKTGHTSLDLTRTRQQAARQLAAIRSTHGDAAIGIRVLSTRAPQASWFLDSAGGRGPMPPGLYRQPLRDRRHPAHVPWTLRDGAWTPGARGPPTP